MSLRMIPEWRSLAELNHLLLDPVFYGIGVPAGDGKPIVLIPGFMEGDASVVLLAHWLRHVGYRPALAGISSTGAVPASSPRRRSPRWSEAPGRADSRRC